MRKFFELTAAALPALAGIGIAIAVSKTNARRRKTLGTVDPYDRTAEPEIDEAEFEIAPGSYSDEDNPTRPSRDEAAWEGGCLVLGKKHPTMGDPYRTCLTANQESTLFDNQRTKLRKLGCGAFACAYESPVKDRVVKFTRDSEDVAALLKAQKTGVAAKVYNVYKLAQGGRTTPVEDWMTLRKSEPKHVDVYAMIVERLQPIPADERDLVQEDMFQLQDVLSSGTPFDTREICKRVKELNIENRGEESGCSPAQVEVLGILRKLRKVGIKWTDYHTGNFGYSSRGKLKALDLGVSKTRLEKEPEILEGRLAAASAKLNLLRAI